MGNAENSYARIEPDLKPPHEKPLEMSALSQEQLLAELEKCYADIAAGRTTPAGEVFASIRKDYEL